MKLPANIAGRDGTDITHIFQEMLGNTCAETKTKHAKLKPVTPFKNYTKSLTARVNNVSACDGNTEWSQTNTAHDLYNKEVKCIEEKQIAYDHIDFKLINRKFIIHVRYRHKSI